MDEVRPAAEVQHAGWTVQYYGSIRDSGSPGRLLSATFDVCSARSSRSRELELLRRCRRPRNAPRHEPPLLRNRELRRVERDGRRSNHATAC